MSKFPREATFKLDGKTYTYWTTRINERCVEVALGIDFLKGATPRVMEVGNVMRCNQNKRKHFVIDLNEKHPGWVNYKNENLLTWKPNKICDKVLSISTIEHCADPVEGCRRVFSWGKEVLITLPLDYIKSSDPQATIAMLSPNYGSDVKLSYMARLHAGEENWKQVTPAEVAALSVKDRKWHGHYHMSASVIAILRKGKP